uniref:Uncharacterized protein n=1 Tax=Amphimedon queenslandica TaxID=400682 RepID=A0A1X7UCF0_AMPQE
MAMYAIGIPPWIKSLESPQTKHLWYTDESAAGGNLKAPHDKFCNLGLKYGYYPNKRKTTHLLVRFDTNAEVVEVFANACFKIISYGVPYLGGVIRSKAFISNICSESPIPSWNLMQHFLGLPIKNLQQKLFCHGHQRFFPGLKLGPSASFENISNLKAHFDPSTQYRLDLCTKKGASNLV